jgi:hypothetical protein
MSRERDRYIADLNIQIADAELIKLEREAGGTLTEDQEKEFQNVQAQRKGVIKVLEAEQAEDNLYTKASKKVAQGKERAKQTGYSLNRWLANIPTPGGVFAAFLVLLFIFMLLIQVNGHSRLFWLWLVIIGRAALPSYETSSSGQGQGKRGFSGPQVVDNTQTTNAPTTPITPLTIGFSGSFQPITAVAASQSIGTVTSFPTLTSSFADLFFKASGE